MILKMYKLEIVLIVVGSLVALAPNLAACLSSLIFKDQNVMYLFYYSILIIFVFFLCLIVLFC